ncbi:protein FAR1-RELATED SEQUENCE 5-like [Beta vulgaris subsp. vulgaris]|uniref:protein FAR1-RELATED SEQUENCE 5-like n=1 Tax=Beta vulgaris subsp. vulgaris TaxID=3555 RepID=UPI00254851D7|nr:protein FAR1-RELATED SEQUENCE 5-like [Beta vulgaris subsp. vulgaris]
MLGYYDSGNGGDLDDPKSTSGYVFTLGGTTVSWQSSLNDVVALSTTEAEFMENTEASKEAKWLNGNVALFHDKIENQFGEQYPTSFVSSDESNSAVIPGSIGQSLNKHEIGGVLLGQVRSTLDDIHELYCQHAAIVGFSHVIKHNHPLTREPLNYLHRSERQMSDPKKQTIQAMQECGLRPIDSFRYMSTEAGGEDVLGHSMKDHFNCCYKLKKKPIEEKDSQKVVDNLYEQMQTDSNFFFRVRLNDEGKVCCLFWRDSMMLEDYTIFGDVMVFDTTYRTNKYNLICPSFVGINNHWKNTMFACAFLADETIPSFEWLFETFKKSMKGKCSITIFSDQDAAIAGTIKKAFPTSRHRLCLWHLSQNANQQFGLMKADKEYKNIFHKCLSGCITTTEFEQTWTTMTTKYKLEDDRWFNRLYNLKEKWCTAFSKDFFSAGILSSQRSESANHAIGFKASKTTSLSDFFSIFQQTIIRWRRQEERDDFDCTKGVPKSDLCMSPLLKHAALVYTHTLFRDFEDEFKHAMASAIELVGTQGNTLTYRVFLNGIDGSSQQVSFNYPEMTIECGCINFQESGWLCFHAIRVLHLHSVQKIPEKYISSRYYNLILKSHRIEPARAVTEESFKKTNSRVEELIKIEEAKASAEKAKAHEKALQEAAAALHANESQENNAQKSPPIPTVLDPDRAVTKGRDNKRIKGHYDLYKKASKKGKKRNKEFGSITPKEHLF